MGNCLKKNTDSQNTDTKNNKNSQNKQILENQRQQQQAIIKQNQQKPVQQQQQQNNTQKQSQNNNNLEAQQQNQVQKPLKSWEIRRLNEKKNNQNKNNFRAKNLENQTIIKKPGDLAGEQFAIDNCKNCIIYILDFTACITIDECINCQIFIGPSESSVFIRDIKDSKLVICCGQFRSRDCYNLQISLFCHTQPIIESSLYMQFGCFQYTYKGFQQQFDAANLNVWNNNWSDVYDFTPHKNIKGTKNYSYLSENFDPNQFLPLPDLELSLNPNAKNQLLNKNNNNNNNNQYINNDQINIDININNNNNNNNQQEIEEDDDIIDDDDLIDDDILDTPKSDSLVSIGSNENNNENNINNNSNNLQQQQQQNEQFQPIRKIDYEIPVSLGLRQMPKNHHTVLYFLNSDSTNQINQRRFKRVAPKFNKYNNYEIYLKRSTIITLDEEQIAGVEELKPYVYQKLFFIYIGGTQHDIDGIFQNWLQTENIDLKLIFQKYEGEQSDFLLQTLFENWNDQKKK